MKKLTIRLGDDSYEDLRDLAKDRGLSMAGLVRFAVDTTFEDELDAMAGLRGYNEYLMHPEDAISFDDFLKERGITREDLEAYNEVADDHP